MDWEYIATLTAICVVVLGVFWALAYGASQQYSLRDYYYGEQHFYLVKKHDGTELMLKEAEVDEQGNPR